MLVNVQSGGLGQNPTHQVGQAAGIGSETSSFTARKVCSSGLEAVAIDAQSIVASDNQVYITGGMENMSAAPYLLEKARQGYSMGDGILVDSMIKDGLSCAFNEYHIGVTAENIARQYSFSREDHDAVAFASQQKAAPAQASGCFDAEITPHCTAREGRDPHVSQDEFVRADTTLDSLRKIRPAFLPDGTVTAGNAVGINDAAAALILMRESTARQQGITPLARIRSWASVGVPGDVMGLGPIPATQKALLKAG